MINKIISFKLNVLLLIYNKMKCKKIFYRHINISSIRMLENESKNKNINPYDKMLKILHVLERRRSNI